MSASANKALRQPPTKPISWYNGSQETKTSFGPLSMFSVMAWMLAATVGDLDDYWLLGRPARQREMDRVLACGWFEQGAGVSDSVGPVGGDRDDRNAGQRRQRGRYGADEATVATDRLAGLADRTGTALGIEEGGSVREEGGHRTGYHRR